MSNYFTIVGYRRIGLSGEDFSHYVIGPYMTENEILTTAGIEPQNRPAALFDALECLNRGKKVFKAFEDEPGGRGRLNFIAAADKIELGQIARTIVSTIRG